jgi:DNA polymerase-3 subunit chi
MAEYWFYHLEASTLEDVLPGLLEKVRERGWTALVNYGGASEERLAELDQFLWTYKDSSFLPHGRDDHPQADQQPIVLSGSADSAGGKDCVILINGAELSDMTGVTRAIVMINGRNTEDVTRERARWARLKDTGANLAYFQQDERGSWVKKV